MKKFFLLAVLFFPIACLCAQTKTTITGNVKHPEGVRMTYSVNEKSYPIEIDKDGKFRIELDLKDFAIVNLSPFSGVPDIVTDAKGSHIPVPSMAVYVEPGENVTVDFDTKEWPIARISGQKTAKDWGYLYELQGALTRMTYENERLRIGYGIERPTPEESEQMDKKKAVLKQQYDDRLKAYCESHPDSYITLVQIRNRVRDDAVEDLEKDFRKLSSRMQASAAGKELEHAILAKKNSRVGVIAPDFTGMTPDGKTIKLSDYRGKYVLLDFWGSWCHACRYSHPHLLELFKKYHSCGLEFVNVASEYQKELAEKKKTWVKAIQEDGIEDFTHVLDTDENRIVESYSIQFFPTKILISPTGEIIARWDGTAETLDSTLEKIFQGK